MKNAFTLSLLMSFLGVNFAQAQGLADPCLGDIKEYCAGVEQGGARVMNCLLDHKDNLTPGCRVRTMRMKDILSSLRKACNDDILSLCEDLEPGEGRLVRCLRDNDQKLSVKCRREIKKTKQAKRSINDTI